MKVLKEGQDTLLKTQKTTNGRLMSLCAQLVFPEMMNVFRQVASTSGSPMMPIVMLKNSPLHIVSHTSVFSGANWKGNSS